MKSVWDETCRRELTDRLRRLTGEHRPQWGRMSPPRMVVHLADAVRMAIGELPVKPHWHPVRLFPFKQLMVYWVPMPKNVPTAPELVARTPRDLQAEIADAAAALERFAGKGAAGPWPDHPIFGPLSPRQWGVLMYRHADHHLRQFGL